MTGAVEPDTSVHRSRGPGGHICLFSSTELFARGTTLLAYLVDERTRLENRNLMGLLKGSGTGVIGVVAGGVRRGLGGRLV